MNLEGIGVLGWALPLIVLVSFLVWALFDDG